MHRTHTHVQHVSNDIAYRMMPCANERTQNSTHSLTAELRAHEDLYTVEPGTGMRTMQWSEARSVIVADMRASHLVMASERARHDVPPLFPCPHACPTPRFAPNPPSSQAALAPMAPRSEHTPRGPPPPPPHPPLAAHIARGTRRGRAEPRGEPRARAARLLCASRAVPARGGRRQRVRAGAGESGRGARAGRAARRRPRRRVARAAGVITRMSAVRARLELFTKKADEDGPGRR